MNKVSPAPEIPIFLNIPPIETNLLEDKHELPENEENETTKKEETGSSDLIVHSITEKEQYIPYLEIQDQSCLEGILSKFSTFADYNITDYYDGETIKHGLRVIHKNKNEKGLGTIVDIKDFGKNVTVKWDKDDKIEEKDFRTGYENEYDLLLFDNSMTGVRHTSVICNECEEETLSGIRWNCLNCDEYDLCTNCYMYDAHDVSHIFKRIECEDSKGVEMPPRLDIQWTGYQSVYGILKNANISTTTNHKNKKSGIVVQTYVDDKYTFRSDAMVEWEDTNKTQHPVGRNGKSELMSLERKEGLQYYEEYLPDVNKDYANQVGIRVVQTHGKDNTKKGCLGTILYGQETKTDGWSVQWDDGVTETYSYNFENIGIKIYDNGPAGIYHELECIECDEPISGMRWKCSTCKDSICTECFMTDKHLKHEKTNQFFRIVNPNDKNIKLHGSRSSTKKQMCYGIVEGAKVSLLTCEDTLGHLEVDFLEKEININKKIQVDIWYGNSNEARKSCKPVLHLIFANHETFDKKDVKGGNMQKEDRFALMDEVMEFSKRTHLPCHIVGQSVLFHQGSSHTVFIHQKTKKETIKELVKKGCVLFQRGDPYKNEDTPESEIHYFIRMAENVLGEKVLPVIISLRNGGLKSDVLLSAEKLMIPIVRFKKTGTDVSVLTFEKERSSKNPSAYTTHIKTPWSARKIKSSRVESTDKTDNQEEIAAINDVTSNLDFEALVCYVVIGVSMVNEDEVYGKDTDVYGNALSMYLLKNGKWRIPKEIIKRSFDYRSIEYIYEEDLSSEFENGLWTDLQELSGQAYISPRLTNIEVTDDEDDETVDDTDTTDTDAEDDETSEDVDTIADDALESPERHHELHTSHTKLEIADVAAVGDNKNEQEADHTFLQKESTEVATLEDDKGEQNLQKEFTDVTTAEDDDEEQSAKKESTDFVTAEEEKKERDTFSVILEKEITDFDTAENENSEQDTDTTTNLEKESTGKVIMLEVSTSDLYGLIFFALLRKEFYSGAKQLVETGCVRIRQILIGCIILQEAENDWQTTVLKRKKLQRFQIAFTQRAIQIISCIYDDENKKEEVKLKVQTASVNEEVDTELGEPVSHAGRLLLNHGYLEDAIKTQNKTFLDNITVTKILNKMWYGVEEVSFRQKLVFIVLAVIHFFVMPLLMINMEARPLKWFYKKYKLPFMKVFVQMLGFLVLMVVYAYMLLFSLNEELSNIDFLIIGWMGSFFLDETKQAIVSARRKRFIKYVSDWWNQLDWTLMATYSCGMSLKFGEDQIYKDASKICLIVTFILFSIRILNMFSMSEFIGPKLVMIQKMFKDTVSFMIILTVIMMSYNVSFYSLLYPNSELSWSVIEKVMQNGYWMLFGELNLDSDTLTEPDCSFNKTIYDSGALSRCPTTLGLQFSPYLKAIYGLIAVIILLNLLIAIYSDTFQQVHQESEFHWNQLQTDFLEEYSIKTIFPIHLQLLVLPACLVHFIIWLIGPFFYSKIKAQCSGEESDDSETDRFNDSPMFVRVFLYNANFDLRLLSTTEAEGSAVLKSKGKIEIKEEDKITLLKKQIEIQNRKFEKQHERNNRKLEKQHERNNKKSDKMLKKLKKISKNMKRMMKKVCEDEIDDDQSQSSGSSDCSISASDEDISSSESDIEEYEDGW